MGFKDSDDTSMPTDIFGARKLQSLQKEKDTPFYDSFIL